MKVLFLDIDGVLNSGDWYERRDQALRKLPNTHHNNGLCELDPVAMGRLNRILAATGAQVVLSSSWRMIALWLETEAPEDVEAFVVLDDSDDMDDEVGIVRPRFVTSWARGLLDEHVDAAIAILGAP